jgi:hypothetical protein
MLMNEDEKEFIRTAAKFLEKPSFLVKMVDVIGKPIEKGIKLLPEKVQLSLSTATQVSLEKGLNLAISTIKPRSNESEKNLTFKKSIQKSHLTNIRHSALTGVSGAVGGLFGLATLPIELPVTTGIMLRSIASIADDYGHDLNDVRTRLECLSVFSMGSAKSADDNEMDSAYFSSRIMMSRLIEDAASWVSKKTAKEVTEAIANKSAPAILRLLSQIAGRFEVIVSEKVIAEAVPVIGALSGSLINMAFSDHFNTIARYHFGLRALEIKYGADEIKRIYKSEM